jgi:signal transduction histidine kinase
LVSLAALWAFAAWVTLREGLNLVWVQVYDAGLGKPLNPLVPELQKERRLLAARLGNPRTVERKELVAQRARTDAAAAEFRRRARGGDVEFAGDAPLKRRIDELITQLDGLDGDRQAIDSGRVERSQAIGLFTGVIDSIYRTYDSMATLDDEGVAKDTRTLIELSRARELLAQEDALLAGVLAAGRYGPTDHAAFAQIVGARRFVNTTALVELPATDRAIFEQLEKGPAFTRLQGLEDAVLESGTRGGVPTVRSDQWKAATEPVLADLQKAIVDAGSGVVERATPIAVGVVVRLVLAGVLGLFAVIASIVLSVTTARALVNQLEKLRTAALELANERLPSVVARLAHGEKVDVAAEAPRLEFGGDVIGQVGQAFNAVQETAIRTAVEEAQLRQSIRDILLSLARRTQSLVHRQLTLLDVMERRETDEIELKDLFRVDHLATRMRRNAENLIVLSGASPARAWRRSVPMVDVVRGALAEVEDYTRVTVLPMGHVELTGRAVGDVIHLLAELIENAVSFSPPYTMVQVGGQSVANGYAIEVEDRGLGMTSDDLDQTNERISNPPEFNLSSTARLGLYVVSRLAERHGIKVALKASPYGGTTAVILLPHELVVEDEEALPQEDGATGGGVEGMRIPTPRIAVVGGRHATTGAANKLDGPQRPAHPESPATPERIPGFVRDPDRPPLPERSPGVVRDPDRPPLPERSPGVVRDADRPARTDHPPLPQRTSSVSREPLATGPERTRIASEPAFTPSGLPFRVPQANIAAPLRGEAPVPVEDDEDDRSPEEIRKIMGSFQMGTQRGRSEAAKLQRSGTRSADEESNQ